MRRQAQHVREPGEKAGCGRACAWKHFFTLGFCYFFAKKKVRELEVMNLILIGIQYIDYK